MFSHVSCVLAWFLKCLGQSINLVTNASDEDPKLKLIVRIGVCTAKSDIPLRTFYHMHTFLN